MNIRAVLWNDLPACADLYMRIFRGPPWHERGWDLEDVQEKLSDLFYTPKYMGLLAEQDGEILGFAMGYRQRWKNEYELHLLEMGVDPARQGEGIGKLLMKALKAQAKKQRVSWISLETRQNIPAETFYHRYGFRQEEPLQVMMCELRRRKKKSVKKIKAV